MSNHLCSYLTLLCLKHCTQKKGDSLVLAAAACGLALRTEQSVHLTSLGPFLLTMYLGLLSWLSRFLKKKKKNLSFLMTLSLVKLSLVGVGVGCWGRLGFQHSAQALTFAGPLYFRGAIKGLLPWFWETLPSPFIQSFVQFEAKPCL